MNELPNRVAQPSEGAGTAGSLRAMATAIGGGNGGNAGTVVCAVRYIGASKK